MSQLNEGERVITGNKKLETYFGIRTDSFRKTECSVRSRVTVAADGALTESMKLFTRKDMPNLDQRKFQLSSRTL